VLDHSSSTDQLIFVNLVDTDMIYGHRRDPAGYLGAVAEIDGWLPRICEFLGEKDFLIITADHGCDPRFRGSDHTREYVPLLLYRPGIPGERVGIFDSFSAVSTIVADYFRGDDPFGFDVLSA